MKLLVCATEYYPYGSGIANVAYNVVENLKKEGIDCTVCSPTGPDIKLGNQFLIKKFGIVGLLYFWFRVSGKFKNNDYNVAWFHNPFFFFSNPFSQCVVTMHSTYRGEWVHQIGNNLLIRNYKKVVAKIERFCLLRMNQSTLFTGVSPTVCEELKQIGINKTQIFYISNGVNTDLFKPHANRMALRYQKGIPDDEIILLNVGRLTPAKQPDVLLRIFSQLEKKLNNISLYIAGNGELFEPTKMLSNELNLKKIAFFGYINHEEQLPNLYAISDYYILTSKYEGAPLTLFEAISSGLPCIVSNIPSLSFIKEANCGIIIDSNKTEEAVNDIIKFFQEKRNFYAENGREYATNKLDWKIIKSLYLNLFK